MNIYTVAVGNHAHVASLKSGERPVEGCRLEFVEVKPHYNAFTAMVRDLKFDFCAGERRSRRGRNGTPGSR